MLTLSLSLSLSLFPSLSPLLLSSTMLGASHGNHITTWAVSQVGLEEVFQTVLAGAKGRAWAG